MGIRELPKKTRVSLAGLSSTQASGPAVTASSSGVRTSPPGIFIPMAGLVFLRLFVQAIREKLSLLLLRVGMRERPSYLVLAFTPVPQDF